jgi:hypothetical protein
MRIYLDNCCFNRPFDNQSSIRVKLETDAKLFVQSKVKAGEIELAWSYILDFENEANPFVERKHTIEKWRRLSVIDVDESKTVLLVAGLVLTYGLRAKDALHIACAVEAQCDYFLTTDDNLPKKMWGKGEITVINPTEFVKIIEET